MYNHTYIYIYTIHILCPPETIEMSLQTCKPSDVKQLAHGLGGPHSKIGGSHMPSDSAAEGQSNRYISKRDART